MSHLFLDWRQELPPAWRGGAVAIGNFDGVHRGHQALVAETARQAQAVSGPTVVHSFDPPPVHLLRPGSEQPPLTPLDERIKLLENGGADLVIILRTTAELLQLTAADFFAQMVQERLAARAMVEGENFRFGHNREGDTALLATLCQAAGIGLTIVPPVVLGARPISSSRVRQALLAGDVVGASEQLGRPYRVQGVVGTGQKRGRTIGFPTANLTDIHSVLPADGVYAVGVSTLNGRWMGAANVGPNPTFGENARKVEIHLLDFTGDLVGQTLSADFFERVRDTKPFPSIADLVAQLHRDVEWVRGLQETYMH
ncbi:MAG TPA: bifunctional riboflavin kinase/FAD synthetase [Gemmataceae bacterium]|nr:bifunctional riboflavin kinase/FAD synthetase [Gemmataceae bacterium]